MVIGAMLLQACLPSKQTPASSASQFSFAFLTDLHIQPERHAAQGVLQAIDTINQLNPDFVITGGDLIMDALGQQYSRADSLYSLYKETMKNLRAPLYNTIGNHELYGLYISSGADTAHPEFGKKMFEKRLSKTYYSFNHKGWHFVVLDAIGTTPDRQYYGLIDDVQLKWLEADLEANKELPTVVSMHIPLYTLSLQINESYAAPISRSEVVTNSRAVREILEKYKVKMVMQGHEHFLEDLYYNGIHYVTGGAVCSAWWTGPNHGLEEGFLLLTVKGEDISWKYIDYGWNAVKE